MCKSIIIMSVYDRILSRTSDELRMFLSLCTYWLIISLLKSWCRDMFGQVASGLISAVSLLVPADRMTLVQSAGVSYHTSAHFISVIMLSQDFSFSLQTWALIDIIRTRDHIFSSQTSHHMHDHAAVLFITCFKEKQQLRSDMNQIYVQRVYCEFDIIWNENLW